MFLNTDAPQMLDEYQIFGGAFLVEIMFLGRGKVNVLIAKRKRFLEEE